MDPLCCHCRWQFRRAHHALQPKVTQIPDELLHQSLGFIRYQTIVYTIEKSRQNRRENELVVVLKVVSHELRRTRY